MFRPGCVGYRREGFYCLLCVCALPGAASDERREAHDDPRGGGEADSNFVKDTATGQVRSSVVCHHDAEEAARRQEQVAGGHVSVCRLCHHCALLSRPAVPSGGSEDRVVDDVECICK